ncbi:hypothetical protein FACS1894186_2900 [Alphaproteobacteria bacterium]|nr:hypothetical protein FACS1894186_2900 [Alphaproteobacteria bacterium]
MVYVFGVNDEFTKLTKTHLKQKTRTLPRKLIGKVYMKKSIIQRIFGRGDVRLKTPHGSLNADLCLKDVPNPDELYAFIKKTYGV